MALVLSCYILSLRNELGRPSLCELWEKSWGTHNYREKSCWLIYQNINLPHCWDYFLKERYMKGLQRKWGPLNHKVIINEDAIFFSWHSWQPIVCVSSVWQFLWATHIPFYLNFVLKLFDTFSLYCQSVHFLKVKRHCFCFFKHIIQ